MSPRQDLLKTTAYFISPEKPRDLLVLIARTALLICLFTSIVLVLYVSFTNRPCPFCRFDSINRNIVSETDFFDGAPTNISHIVFGIGGSAKTWKERRAFSSLWYDVNSTRGFAWLDEEPDKNGTVNGYDSEAGKSLPYRLSGPEWTRFKYSSARYAVRIARIIYDSFNLKLPNVRWYDHREMWYIGGNSESIEQNVMHAYDMAFGGGGFALSYPLAKKLVKQLDGCLEKYFYFFGSDQRIWACISDIGVPLTKEPGFHQVLLR
ncbi:hypothetical protein COLO4_25483 [Corchorus olitorius]|uniref:Fringe-related protein n=1 Tax=Corchorus olitorius TaxID=93759 RepID=A0A1R3I278_9ROSI|nr:hypothetical protein COLO4_25483 [Corchorus olitorius]